MGPTMNRRQRTELTARIPWVTRLARARQCDGKSGTCKLAAYWRFRALKKSWARSGNYCRCHLFHAGLYADVIEEERTNLWWDQHGDAICRELGIIDEQ